MTDETTSWVREMANGLKSKDRDERLKSLIGKGKYSIHRDEAYSYRGISVQFEDGRTFHKAKPVPVEFGAYQEKMKEIEEELVQEIKGK